MAVQIDRHRCQMAERRRPTDDALPTDDERQQARDRDHQLEQALLDHRCFSSSSGRIWIARSDTRTSTMNDTSAAISSTIARMKEQATRVPKCSFANSATNSKATTMQV